MKYTTKSVKELCSYFGIDYDSLNEDHKADWKVEFKNLPEVTYSTWAYHWKNKHNLTGGCKFPEELKVGSVYLCYQVEEKTWYWLRYLGDMQWSSGYGYYKWLKENPSVYDPNTWKVLPYIEYSDEYKDIYAKYLGKNFQLDIPQEEENIANIIYKSPFKSAYINKPIVEKKIRYLNKTSESV
jgi:hypothetical protein